MSCTKLLFFASISKRLFCIFDKDKPYDLILKYRKIVPKRSGGSGIGFGSGSIHFTDVENTEYEDREEHRVKSPEEANEIIARLRKGYCFKCGNKKACQYFNV